MEKNQEVNLGLDLRGCELLSYDIKGSHVVVYLDHPQKGLIGPLELDEGVSNLVISIIAAELQAAQKVRQPSTRPQKESKPVVVKALSGVPWAPRRNFVDWRNVEGLFTEDVNALARRLGVSVGSVRWARRKLEKETQQAN